MLENMPEHSHTRRLGTLGMSSFLESSDYQSHPATLSSVESRQSAQTASPTARELSTPPILSLGSLNTEIFVVARIALSFGGSMFS